MRCLCYRNLAMLMININIGPSQPTVAYPVENSPHQSVMSPEQSRAARGWLAWSQIELAQRANVSVGTVRSFEGGQRTPVAATLSAMRQVIEAAGIRLLFDRNGDAAGIARQDAGRDLFDDASQS